MKSEEELNHKNSIDTQNEFGKKLKDGLENQWKVSLEKKNCFNFQIADVTLKQKEYYRDIFANITTKRILFSLEKRIFYSLANNKFISNSSFVEAILLPINSEEIQDVLSIAQNSEIKLKVFQHRNSAPIQYSPKSKGACVISIELMQKILKFSPETEQITVQSGIHIGKLIQYLKEQGWELSIPFTGEDHLTVYEWILSHHIPENIVSKCIIHTPSGTLHVQNDEPLFSYLWRENKNLGVCSELTLKIKSLPKYIRKVEASFHDLKSCVLAFQLFRENGLKFRQLSITHFDSKSILQHFLNQETEQDSTDFFTSIFKKVSNKSDSKDEEEYRWAMQIEIEEYHYNISAAILKVKELLQQTGAKSGTVFSQDILSTFSRDITNQILHFEELEVDSFYLQSWIPVQKMDTVYSELKKQLEKSSFYPANKSSYQILFTENTDLFIKLEVYFLASGKHRKEQETPQKLHHILNEILLIPKTKNLLHQEIHQILYQKLDAKLTMIL